MTPQLDAGPVVAQDRTAIDPEETAEQLEGRLSEMAARLVRRVLGLLESGGLEALPQDSRQASKAPRLAKSDGLIDWTRSAAQIKNHVRAMQPWPGAFTFWRRSSGPALRLILGSVSVEDAPPGSALPGVVAEAEGDRLVVASGQGFVVLHTVQLAGKRMLTAGEFLRGHRVRPGETFGPN
jgi:methionyl-tRNA formyltransferase